MLSNIPALLVLPLFNINSASALELFFSAVVCAWTLSVALNVSGSVTQYCVLYLYVFSLSFTTGEVGSSASFSSPIFSFSSASSLSSVSSGSATSTADASLVAAPSFSFVFFLSPNSPLKGLDRPNSPCTTPPPLIECPSTLGEKTSSLNLP